MPPLFAHYASRIRRQLLQGIRLPLSLGLLTTAFVFWLSQPQPPLFRDLLNRLDFMVYDLRFDVLPRTPPNPDYNIVIVDYDQRSLEAEGQWPWSRFKLAELVDRLAGFGVAVIGFDVFFPEYERNLLLEFSEHAVPAAGDNSAISSLLQQLQPYQAAFDADAAFADAMQNAEVVLGFSFSAGANIRSGVLPAPIFSMSPQEAAAISLPQMRGYTANVDTLQNAARGGGFFDTIPDIDGVIRSYNLVLQHDGNIYPSLALEMARLYKVVDEFSATMEGDLQDNGRELVSVNMGGDSIPTDPIGRVLVPYAGPQGSFPYISATDILRGTLSIEQQQQLENSLVLVGTTSTGLYDLRATPLQAVYPGVEIHANVLNAILSSSRQVSVDGGTDAQSSMPASAFSMFDAAKASPFPSRPDWVDGATMALVLVSGIALSLICPLLGPGMLTLLSLLSISALLSLNFMLWNRYQLDFPLVLLLLLVGFITVGNLAYGFLREGLTKRAIKGMFDQYVPPAHIDAMLSDPEKYDFSGESKHMSVLFSDIRNFTAISEKLTATELKALLNDFFTPVTALIFEHNGTIDKYVGDMVMAFWGAPLDDPHHGKNAVLTALAMLKKVATLRTAFGAHGLPPIDVGIGINSGMMNVGDMGSTYRRAYTVIGDEVNLGSRLEGLTKAYGVNLLIGENTFATLEGVLCRQIDKVQVKGKQQPVRIYQPLCLQTEASAELREQVAQYHAAYQLYLQQHWDEAEAAFRRLAEREQGAALYRVYLDRIALLRTQILPAEWDGTYRHTSK